jgi:hypothetical protein
LWIFAGRPYTVFDEFLSDVTGWMISTHEISRHIDPAKNFRLE